MSIWRRLYAKPSGAIPGALFTRIGVAALALLCGGDYRKDVLSNSI